MSEESQPERRVLTVCGPSLNRHRDASENTQDISHLLASIFKDLCYLERDIPADGAGNKSRRGGVNAQVKSEYRREMRDEDMEKHIIRPPPTEQYTRTGVLNELGETYQRSPHPDRTIPSIPEFGESLKMPPPPELSTLCKNAPKEVFRPAQFPKLSESLLTRENATAHKFMEQRDFLNSHYFLPSLTCSWGQSLITPRKKVQVKESVKIKPMHLTHSIMNEPVPVFLANPAFVLFSDYKVGQVYECAVQLQNMTASSHHVRVIPPATPHFSITLGKFPGEGGMVAPGMSCQYKVYFTPDSLSNFEDILLVETLAPYPLIVPIEAWRPPPILTLARILDCGYCLVGGVKIVEFQCRNEGLSNGTFCIIPKKLWPASNFRSVVISSYTEQPPFRISPSLFDLLPGEATVLEVAFFPAMPKSFVEVFSIVCDNCQVKDITIQGIGEIVTLELVSVSDGEDYHLPGEICDMRVDHLVRFGLTNPYCMLQKRLVIRNNAHLELPFCWEVMQPTLERHLLSEEQLKTPHFEYCVTTDSAFDVSPREGLLQPHQDHEFLLSYCPLELKEYHSVCHLLLRDIQDFPVDPNAKIASQHCWQVAKVSDVVAMTIEVKGSTKPRLVLLEPCAVYFPGENYIGMPIRERFKMWNLSTASINFQWDRISDFCILEVKPSMGEIETNQCYDLELVLTGMRDGPFETSLQCHIEYHQQPITLNVQAVFKGPKLAISVPSLDLGLIQLGDQARATLHITNKTLLEASWTLLERCNKHQADETQITVEPCHGVLPMLSSCSVDVLFSPVACQHFETVLELAVENGTGCHLSVKADVQSPQACLLNCELVFTELYVGVPTSGSTTIFNQTLLPVHFSWEELWGKQKSLCAVSFTPCSGILRPNTKLEIMVQFTAHTDMELTEVAAVCVVKGMQEPLILGFFSKAKNLNVSFSLFMDCPEADNQDQLQLVLDFGDDVQLERPVTRQLAIRNQTAIAAPFSVKPEFFAPPCIPFSPSTGDGVQLHQRTSYLKEFQSVFPKKVEQKAMQQFVNSLLAHGKGATFYVEPACGILGPFETQTMDITAFTNMWGKYRDRLICKIGGLKTVFIPVKMNVRGCPLYFQITGPQVENEAQSPVIRFGTHVSGGHKVIRSLRLNNPSPCNIYLDWETFNQVKGDKKLLDLIVTFKEAFRLKDADGNEISDGQLGPSHRASPSSIPRDTPSSGGKSSWLRSEVASGDHKGKNDDSGANCHHASVRKLISLHIRSHEGIASDFPYSITPQKMVVAAGGSSTVNVSFTPKKLSGSTSSIACLGFALGFMSLDSKGASCHLGNVERAQSYDLEPLKLGLEACVKTPFLSVEMDEEEEALEFFAVASDLLPRDSLTEVVKQLAVTRTIRLRNKLEMPLSCRLSTQSPFSVLEAQPRNHAKSPRSNIQDPAFLVLQPQHSIKVQMAFHNSLSLLTYLSLPAEQVPPTVQLMYSGNGERRLQFRHNLFIEYSNSSVQAMPLCAYLLLPTLHLSADNLDFGICYVGQKYTKEVFLYNRGGSGSYWTATIETDEGSASFTVAPKHGFLNPLEFPTSSCRNSLQISFIASDTCQISATITVKGILGEEPLSLCVQGRGSFDEKFASLEIEANMKTEE
ncbi:deleted in lung and esophageal cancer protein 1 isoform X2 [Scleropages formosus]|uniref:deleted in lung and esophageal cancer protein 1 isoform X2 n=1 Tax=Scleropages formosus TaxID=113540 RepID=UPI0008780CE9|nr:deleted in lung and esophageal cancer protein 1 isoform X2 [Scleropages formosus]